MDQHSSAKRKRYRKTVDSESVPNNNNNNNHARKSAGGGIPLIDLTPTNSAPPQTSSVTLSVALLSRKGSEIMTEANRIACEKITELENALKVKEEENKKIMAEANRIACEKITELENALKVKEEENKKNAAQYSALQLEKKEADEQLKMLEELHNWIIQLETELDEKPALKLEIEQLRESFEKKDEELENSLQLNQTLIVRDIQSNDELQQARKILINGLNEISRCAHIGVKRIGELEIQPFVEAMRKSYTNKDVAEAKGAALCSLWEENLRDPHWHPFKTVLREEEEEQEHQVIIDENDEKLEDLRLKWGEEIYEVVTDALLEIKENGTSCFELWNFAEERKASIDEAIKCLLQKLQKTHKLADTRTPTITKG